MADMQQRPWAAFEPRMLHGMRVRAETIGRLMN